MSSYYDNADYYRAVTEKSAIYQKIMELFKDF